MTSGVMVRKGNYPEIGEHFRLILVLCLEIEDFWIQHPCGGPLALFHGMLLQHFVGRICSLVHYRQIYVTVCLVLLGKNFSKTHMCPQILPNRVGMESESQLMFDSLDLII